MLPLTVSGAAAGTPGAYCRGDTPAITGTGNLRRGENSGSARSIVNPTGRPAAKLRRTFVQSSSVVFSTIAQPCTYTPSSLVDCSSGSTMR